MYFNLRFLQEKENNKQTIYEYFTLELDSLFLDKKIFEELNNYLNEFINENYMQFF